MNKSRLLLIFVCLLFVTKASAQPTNLNPVEPKRESAGATLKTFFDAFGHPRVGVTPDPLEEAVKCLDLQGIPPEYRGVKGLEEAVQLKEIIDTVENFHREDASLDTNGEPFVVFRSTQGEITLAKQANGEWLFTQETVRSVPLLLATIEEERRKHGTATLTQSESFGAQIRERMPAVLKQKTLYFERWQWIGLGVLLLIALGVWQIVKFLSDFTIGRILRRRYKSLTEKQITNIYSPVGLLAFVITFRLGLRALALTQNALTSFRTAMFIITAVAIIWLLYKVVDIVAFRLRRKSQKSDSQADDLLVPFVSAIIRMAIIIIGAIFVAENLHFDVTGLIAGLGIGGIAIALASQETLSNFFGSLVLLIEQPFRAEDRVEIENVKGVVKEVGLRSTKIFTSDNSLITLPNSTIAKAAVLNDGVARQRRWILKLHLPYQEAIKVENFCIGVKEILSTDENLDNETSKMHLFDFTPPAIIIRIEFYFKVDNWTFELDARHKLLIEILRLADKLEVRIEVPN